MDTTQWAQGIGLVRKPIEDEILIPNNNNISGPSLRAPTLPQQPTERKARPQKEQVLHCPRCNSTNTKFCYYNNYSLTQPRYFCKTCRRYWTEGGSLRNVPVGGGSRKNKRHSSSAGSGKSINPPQASTTAQTTPVQFDHVQDLNLGFPNHSFLNLDSTGGVSGELSAMELLRSSGITARGLGPLVPMQMQMPVPAQQEVGQSGSAGLFPFDGGMDQEGGRRMLFPFADQMKQEQNRGQGGGGDQSAGAFWNGMMGGAGSGDGGSW